MKAVVFRDVGDIRLEEVKDPNIQESTDAIVRLTPSAEQISIWCAGRCQA